MTKKHNDPDNGHHHSDGHSHEHPHGEHPPEQGAEQSPPEDLESLKAQLEAKDKELAELKDKYLRALADFENARKRIRQQSEESAKLQRESLLRDLLPIIDNLERAVEAAKDGGNGKPI